MRVCVCVCGGKVDERCQRGWCLWSSFVFSAKWREIEKWSRSVRLLLVAEDYLFGTENRFSVLLCCCLHVCLCTHGKAVGDDTPMERGVRGRQDHPN